MTSSRPPAWRVLVVDDDADELARCAGALQALTGVPVEREPKSRSAAERLKEERFDLLVTDLRMPVMDGLDLLRAAHSVDPEIPVVVLTGYPSVDTAVQSLKLGAADYLSKPVNTDELVEVARRLLAERRLRGEHRLLQRQLDRPYAFDEIVGESAPMREVFAAIEQVASSDVDVLILGETGTGKEVVARSIHARGASREGRFVPVDCGAIPENLLESELFGFERGAFSGAHARSIGLLEYADRGTFFLDEVIALPPALQAKLLRALQERRIRRLGARTEITVRVRVIAAANRDPAGEIEEGRFREDLYYRLNVGRIELPPLRERAEDIPLLATHFLARFAGRANRPDVRLSDAALDALCAYSWPGNVRQLQNVLRRALAMSRADILQPEDLGEEVVGAGGDGAGAASAPSGAAAGSFFAARAAHVDAFEREYLRRLLAELGGDVSAAARRAQMPRGTLYRLLAKHGMKAADFRSAS